MTHLPLLRDIIEAPLADLLEWQRSAAFELTDDHAVYISTLISYLQSDLRGIATSIDLLQDLNSPLAEIAELRLLVRQKALSTENIKKHFESVNSINSSPELRGEAGFVGGFASWSIGDYDNSLVYYTDARKQLMLCGAHKKALKVAQNILATKTCLNPQMKCIPEYHQIFLEARKLHDYATCGLAMQNMSREYQKMGALNLALKTINVSINHFKKELGTLHYYISLAHRAHVLIQLGDYRSAVCDIEECLTSNFPEIHNAIRVLEKIETQSKSEGSIQLLIPTWRARLSRFDSEKDPKNRLHELEERLVAILRGGPKAKADLVQELYGTKIDYESAENRFKNLLVRIRKKAPTLISFDNQHYNLREGK